MQTLILLGHPAYKGTNARRVCFSKSQAIRVLRNRGMTRDAARHSLDREFDPHSRRGSISVSDFQSIECMVYVDQMPHGWHESYDEIRAKHKGISEH